MSFSTWYLSLGCFGGPEKDRGLFWFCAVGSLIYGAPFLLTKVVWARLGFLAGVASVSAESLVDSFCTVPKYRAAVDYTLTGVEPHGPTRGVWPIAVVAMIANHIWKHSVFKVMHSIVHTLKCRDLNVGTRT